MHSTMNWQWDDPYILPVTAEQEQLDGLGHVNNVSYLRWLEAAAWAHSIALGIGLDEFKGLDRAMVARRHELDYLLPCQLGDELLVGTWITSNDCKLSMERAYQIVRPLDNKTVFTGMTRWVCVALRSGKPKRMPAEFITAYQPGASS
ncbi:MAG: acyl-CoA thioesterase [Pseudomonadales bacterium]